VFYFLSVEVFFVIVEDALGFEVFCFVSVCAEAAWAEAATPCELLFPRTLLLRTCVTGASFTGSATTSELPGFTAFDDK
jgi:hypothetical protein